MKKTNKPRTPQEQYARDVKIEKVKIGALCLGGILLFAVLLALFASSLAEGIRKNQPEQAVEVEVFGAAAEPAEGVGRVYAEDAQRYAAGETATTTGTALRVFCETDPDLPAWWNPEGAEIVYQEPIAQTTHSDALDYNLNTTVWGWDGHGAEIWELDLLSRIFYLEFWGASPECCEAGIDAILRLWESGEFGNTLGGVLTAVNAAGKYVYSTYPDVWTTDYNAKGLAWCRAYCEERFATGPVWIATYFQKYGYPDWGVWSPVPCYCLDGVFFSVSKWGN